ncbi:unnamed protein product, partial [Linum tenue]
RSQPLVLSSLVQKRKPVKNRRILAFSFEIDEGDGKDGFSYSIPRSAYPLLLMKLERNPQESDDKQKSLCRPQNEDDPEGPHVGGGEGAASLAAGDKDSGTDFVLGGCLNQLLCWQFGVGSLEEVAEFLLLRWQSFLLLYYSTTLMLGGSAVLVDKIRMMGLVDRVGQS